MNAGTQCRVATGFPTIVSCSDFTGFSSDYFQCKVGSFQTKLSVAVNGSHDSKSEINVTTWLISAHARWANGDIHYRYCVSEYTDIKLDDCDKHVQTDCKNDHSTSEALGHSDRTFNKLYFDLCLGASAEDAESVINIPLPQPGSGWCRLQCQFLKELHIEVAHHSRDRRAYRRTFCS